MYSVYNNITQCAQYLIQMVSIMETYLGLHIKYLLSCVLIFWVRDPTSMSDYRIPRGWTCYLVCKGHETTQRFQFDLHSNEECTRRWPVLLLLSLHLHFKRPDLCGWTWHTWLTILTCQQAGWNLGTCFNVDVRCLCIRTPCILYKFPVLTDSFSNCSILHFQHTVYKLRHCL